jgi:ATP-dependent RNA helicase DeaD
MSNYDNNDRDYDNRNSRDDRRDSRSGGNGGDEGKTQLFFAKGRNDGMTQEALIEFISSRAQIDETVIGSIKILDAFSFFVVPQEDAEIILDFFQEEAGEGRPLVSKAKRKTENRDRDFGRRDDRRDDRRGFGGGYRNDDRGGRRDDRRGGDSYGNSGNSFGGGNDRRPRNY